MLKLTYPGILFVSLLCSPVAHADAAANKCTDGHTITYANIPCEDLGLKSAGPIKSAITVVPPMANTQPNPAKNNEKKKANPDADASDADVHGTEKIQPVNPLIKKMLD